VGKGEKVSPLEKREGVLVLTMGPSRGNWFGTLSEVPSEEGAVCMRGHELFPVREPGGGTEGLVSLKTDLRPLILQIPENEWSRLETNEELYGDGRE
jgi:hypothetical protein